MSRNGIVRGRFLPLLAVICAGIFAGCVGPKDTWVHASSRRFELLGATSQDSAEELVRTLEREPWRIQYATAIQLMHLLQARYPQQLTAFETAMHEGTEWEKAWSQAFADRSAAQLTKELQAFALTQHSKASTGRVSFPLSKPIVEPARAASGAETHAARALLYALAQGRRSEAQALALAQKELTAALSQDDAGAIGLVTAALLYDAYPELRVAEVEIGRIRRVLARDPTNWRAAVLLAGTDAPLPERTQVLVRAAARDPNEYVMAALDRLKVERDTGGAPEGAK